MLFPSRNCSDAFVKTQCSLIKLFKTGIAAEKRFRVNVNTRNATHQTNYELMISPLNSTSRLSCSLLCFPDINFDVLAKTLLNYRANLWLFTLEIFKPWSFYTSGKMESWVILLHNPYPGLAINPG